MTPRNAYRPRQKDQGDTAWMTRALCRGMDPNLFFPERGASSQGVKQVCRPCPVREECLDYAFRTFQWKGVWGGTTEGERRVIRRNRIRQQTRNSSCA